MEKNHDEMLDDLIKYYDSDAPSTSADSGDTTIINVKRQAPPEETFGDTVIVNVKKKPTEPKTETSETEHTTLISPRLKSTVPEPKQAPAEEVFGNMDLSGNVIEPEPKQERPTVEPIVQQPPSPQPTTRISRSTDIPPREKRGLWYSLKPLWATILVCIALVASYMFYVTDTGIVGVYKRNFTYNLSLILRSFGIEYDPYQAMPIVTGHIDNPFIITAYAEGEDTSYTVTEEAKATIPFEGADSAKFQKADNGVVCAKPSYICFINKAGKTKWEHNTAISEPLLSTAGKYTALAAKNSTQLILYKNGKQVFSIDAPNNIKACKVSEKGDVVLVTDKTAYKGAVSVINKKGEEVFSWISGVNYITAAEILNNRHIAVALAGTEKSVKSYVMLFDIYSTAPLGGAEIDNSLVFDLEARKKTVYSFSDNAISSVSSDGSLNYTVRFDNMDISHSTADAKGWRLVSYTDGHLPYLNLYKPNGDLHSSVAAESTPEHIDLYKSTVLCNNGRDILCGGINKKKNLYRAPMSIKKLIMITKNTYMAVYENSLEIIKI